MVYTYVINFVKSFLSADKEIMMQETSTSLWNFYLLQYIIMNIKTSVDISEVIQKARPVHDIKTYKTEREHDFRQRVDPADADRAGLAEGLEIPVLGVSSQTVQEHAQAVLFLPARLGHADHSVPVNVCGERVAYGAVMSAVRLQ